MEDFVQEFQKKHPGIRVDAQISLDYIMDDDGDEVEVENTAYNVTCLLYTSPSPRD